MSQLDDTSQHTRVMSRVPSNSIATSSNSPNDIPYLLGDIARYGSTLSYGQPGARLKLLSAARSLVNAVETPKEAMMRLCWTQSTTFAAIEIALDLGLFGLMAEDGGGVKTVSELADGTGADPVLLGRIMKHLGAMGVIAEAGPDEYRSTGFSTAFTIPRSGASFPFMTRCIIPAVQALPEYFTTKGYKNPCNLKDSPFNYAFNTELTFFEFMKEHPQLSSLFNSHMSEYHQGRPSWMDADFYPVGDRLVKGARADRDAVFLVDVGGNVGHDLEEFHSKFPNVPGKLVLQDLLPVISDAGSLHSSIQPMVHDFLTEQPVKGARAYYMHSILHDWPDNKCREILANLVPAMTPGYSKLLINENVISDMNTDWEITSLDLMMMAVFWSQERTERHWRELTASAGLKVVNIWSHEEGVESLIECEVAPEVSAHPSKL